MFAFMQRAGYAVSDVSVESDAPLDYARLVAGDAPLESANGACSEPY
jgi:hypothetical protein